MEKREIKFRVWDGKEMVYSGNPPAFGFWKYAAYDSGCLKTLMQFTGLKDKNGKEIYEGDILSHPSTNKRMEVKHGLIGWIFSSGNVSTSYSIEFKIIGNIYENPDSKNFCTCPDFGYYEINGEKICSRCNRFKPLSYTPVLL